MTPETMLAELAKRANPDGAPTIAGKVPTKGTAFSDLPETTKPITPTLQIDDSDTSADPAAIPNATNTATSTHEVPTENPIYDNISEAYRQLRIGMALLAIAMPIALMVGGGLSTIQTSLSAYYHFDGGVMRDWFVGILWAIGAFVLFYKGYTNRENIALNIAGIAAVTVALFPTGCTDTLCEPGTVLPSYSSIIHGTAAVTFFLLIAYVCVCRSGDTLQLMEDQDQKNRFTLIYRLLGLAMVVMPLGVIAIEFLGNRGVRENFWIMLVEVIGIAVFATFWLYKSHEIRLLERQHC